MNELKQNALIISINENVAEIIQLASQTSTNIKFKQSDLFFAFAGLILETFLKDIYQKEVRLTEILEKMLLHDNTIPYKTKNKQTKRNV